MTALRVEGAAQLKVLADRLKDAGDKKLKRQVSKAMRGVGEPLGRRVLDQGADHLGHRGGLAAHVAAGKVSVRASLAGRNATVALLLKGDGYDLRPIDQKGMLRHPVFGRKTWVSQRVQANRFTVAFLNEAPAVRGEVLKAAQGVLNDVARGL